MKYSLFFAAYKIRIHGGPELIDKTGERKWIRKGNRDANFR